MLAFWQLRVTSTEGRYYLTHLLHAGRNHLHVESFTEVPKRVVNADGETVEFDKLLLDPRNFTDATEMMVLWWTVRQVLRFENKRQVAEGAFSVKTITDATGYHHKTVWTRLGALQRRKILEYRAGKGVTTRGSVVLNLRLYEWQPPIPKEKKPRGRHAIRDGVVQATE